ncbi:MAG: carbamate kinase [Thermoplasmata archaeon]
MKTAIIAVGGNALTKKDDDGNIYQQFANARETCAKLIKVVEMGYDIIITHGNGPQVGDSIRRHEHARKIIPPYPLGVCVAETVGSMGYMLQQTMQNTVKKSKVVRKDTVTIITQVVVDDDDPSFKNPTKPIGQFFSKEEIEEIAKTEKWAVVEDSGRGWRRVVPSPKPLRIVEKDTIGDLLSKGKIVIACGGGGLPVIQLEDGTLDGVEAVIDKDYASSKLAQQLDLDELIILTAVDKVSINFGKPDQVDLDILTVKEARKHLKDGQFPPGSMGPKIDAAIQFIENGGRRAIIASYENLVEAMKGEAGTRIVR